MKKELVNIEKLIAKKDSISSEAVKSAISKLEQQKKEADEKRVIDQIAEIQRNTQHAVESLRAARKEEKRQRAYLQGMADAEAQFYKDADYEAYNAAIFSASKELYK